MGFPDHEISRRQTLQILGGVLAAGAADWGLASQLMRAGGGAGPAKRPNIVFILSDDHRADTMGNAGHPFIRTPNLDRLAGEGVKFSNTFAATPLCSPSRGCFLTGQYAHRHGVKNNFTPWNDRNVTFLELLKKAGYKNAFFGKWHMPGRLPNLLGKALDRFVTFTASGGQGLYFDCPLIIDGKMTERRGKYLTEDLTDLALDFIRKEKDGPFCVYLAHKAPHQPFVPPRELKSLYEDAEVRRTLPPEYHPFIHRKEGSGYYGILGSVGEKYLDYHRVITALDQQIGRILSELDRLGLTENTIVVYTSDNGYFWGEKQLIDKRFPYEEATRIPLIVRYPAKIKKPGSTSSEMTLSIDLAPTLLDLAGVPIPGTMQGRNFSPLLKGDSNLPLRAAVHLEYFKDFPYSVPEWDAVRTERYLYVEYQNKKSTELFDIQKDPRTLHNLIQTPEGKRVLPELRKTMRAYLGRKTDG
ncbi:MAG: sulfatase [Thermodesulfobacteriota bacterium]